MTDSLREAIERALPDDNFVRLRTKPTKDAPSYRHVRDAAYEAVAPLLAAEREEGRREGYYIGFNEAGEGWNGEYPFGDDGIDPRNDAYWVERRDRVLCATLAASDGEPKP